MAKNNIAADTLLCTRIYRPMENLYHRGFAQVDVRLMMKLAIVLDEGGGANLLKDNESQDVKEQHRGGSEFHDHRPDRFQVNVAA